MTLSRLHARNSTKMVTMLISTCIVSYSTTSTRTIHTICECSSSKHPPSHFQYQAPWPRMQHDLFPKENILIFMLSMLLSMATRITLSHAHNCWERLGMKERWWVSSQPFYLPSSSRPRSEHQGLCQVILSFLRFTTSNTTRP